MNEQELLQELLRRYPDQRVSEDPVGAGMLNGLGTQQPEPMTGTGLQAMSGSTFTEDSGDTAQVIGPEEIAKAGETLQKYKAGKASLTSGSWRTSCGSAWDTGRTAKTR